jgi:hypothetical protein
MPKKRRPKGSRGDSLKDTYARIRKPIPPPSRVEEDRRRELLEEIEEREIEDEDVPTRKDDPQGS